MLRVTSNDENNLLLLWALGFVLGWCTILILICKSLFFNTVTFPRHKRREKQKGGRCSLVWEVVGKDQIHLHMLRTTTSAAACCHWQGRWASNRIRNCNFSRGQCPLNHTAVTGKVLICPSPSLTNVWYYCIVPPNPFSCLLIFTSWYDVSHTLRFACI